MALRSSENRRDLRDRETPTSKERKIVDATAALAHQFHARLTQGDHDSSDRM
jgi:hypothetical protein